MLLYDLFFVFKNLGREDSNLRMAEPKPAALPLGDAPFLKYTLYNLYIIIRKYFVNFNIISKNFTGLF